MDENREAAEAALGGSTVLDASQPNERPLSDAAFDAPQEETKPEAPKQPSTREAITAALDEAEAKEKPADEKPEKAKPDDDAEAEEKKAEKARAEDGKFAKAKAEEDQDKSAPEKAATGQDGAEKQRQSEGRQIYEPPARFLPKAKEDWRNVPYAVKAEISRLSQEHEAEVSQYRESHEEMQKLSKFTDMAKQHNTSINDALERYTAVDHLLHSNPVEGIRQVLETIGLTPEKYAQHVLQNPDVHKPAPQPRAPDPAVRQTMGEVEHLKAELTAMKQEQAARSIIDPFRASHPRYDELQDDIALFLSSGKVPTSLPPHERLEAAYDMAARINPASSVEPPVARAAPVDVPSEPVVDPRGQKSVRGAPSGGHDPSNRRAKNNRDAASAALAELGI